MTAGADGLLLGRYREDDLLAMFVEAGVAAAVDRRGYRDLELTFDTGAGPLTHVRLHGSRDSARHLLLDTCLSEVSLDATNAERCGYGGPLPVELVVVYWLREQDPAASFDPAHPRLPLQEHPGLGVLRRAFRVALRIANDLGKHGIAALPKFFHDASIFWHSRLFLFLDPREQGRFEALLRDLAALPLADASLALAAGAVRDREGRAVHWQSGFQVTPLASPLTEWFHSAAWQEACRVETERSRYVVDPAGLEEARRVFASSPP